MVNEFATRHTSLTFRCAPSSDFALQRQRHPSHPFALVCQPRRPTSWLPLRVFNAYVCASSIWILGRANRHFSSARRRLRLVWQIPFPSVNDWHWLTRSQQLSRTARYDNRPAPNVCTKLIFPQQGKGLVKVNGKPLSLTEPQILRFKVYEPILILGVDKFGTNMETQKI